MSISTISICNEALALIGARLITDLDDTQKEEARFCKTLFPGVRDQVLRMFPWRCAIHRQSVPAESTAPLWGFAYQYPLPTDPYCLRVLKLHDPADPEGDGYDFQVTGRRVETDAESPIMVEYIKRITDSSQIDSLLAEAISAMLAAKLAYKLSANNTTRETMMVLFNQALAVGRSMSEAEQNTSGQDETRRRSNSWLTARA